jgi:hypothetical protein
MCFIDTTDVKCIVTSNALYSKFYKLLSLPTWGIGGQYIYVPTYVKQSGANPTTSEFTTTTPAVG